MLNTDAATPQAVMAFDFGTQKMGIANGHSLTGTATALPLFPMRDGIPDWDNLEKIIGAWQPDIFLVGLPLNMDDSESELSMRARKFARRLKHRLNKPVWMVDERLSTRDARDNLSKFQKNKQAKNISADSLAAVLLIESWFREPYGLQP
jgi:putative Holliday junction resolvase